MRSGKGNAAALHQRMSQFVQCFFMQYPDFDTGIQWNLHENLDSLKIYGIIENAEQFGMNRFCSKS